MIIKLLNGSEISRRGLRYTSGQHNFSTGLIPASICSWSLIQWRWVNSDLRLWVNGRLIIHKNLGHWYTVFLGCEMQWLETIVCDGVNCSAVLQQQGNHLLMAFLRCQMQWCVTILSKCKNKFSYQYSCI